LAKEVGFHDREHYLNTIAQDYLLKGINNPTRIAKELGIQRKDVLVYVEDIRAAWNNGDAKARATELLAEMDKAYDQLINEFWILHAEAAEVKDKNGILKNISEVIAKRQDVLQKAGLYDDAMIGDELALVEEQMQAIKDLLKSVAKNHPAARAEIMTGLGVIFKEAQSMPVGEGTSSPSA
jgi:hypothetical protein